MATRHKSLSLSDKYGWTINNERLEFLGDAVLNSIVSDILYHHYKNKQEGFLTNARSNIVKRESLNEICRKIHLDQLIIINKSLNNQKNENIYGNALEALIGAIYIDHGYKKCKEFVSGKLLKSLGKMDNLALDNENYKSELLEWCQKNRFNLEFELISESVDNKNNHVFTSILKINGQTISSGSGANKKESHQQAAKEALEIIGNQPDFLNKIADSE